MDPLEIIRKHYKPHSKAYEILIKHGQQVARKAISIAKRVKKRKAYDLDIAFIYEASMLHDIGICHTNAPKIGCFGKSPYIAHGFLGRKMLDEYALNKHANVCERHTGVGLEKKEIKDMKLPLPHHDMVPITIEEMIICYADKFYSKKIGKINNEKSVDEIVRNLKVFGNKKSEQFLKWHQIFS